jgi:hypothetical protein
MRLSGNLRAFITLLSLTRQIPGFYLEVDLFFPLMIIGSHEMLRKVYYFNVVVK